MLSRTLRRIFLDYHNIDVGLYSYGGCFDSQLFGAHAKIGRYCSFAPGVCRFNGNHPLTLKSMHPYFYNPMWSLFGDFSPGPPGTYYYSESAHNAFFWYMFEVMEISKGIQHSANPGPCCHNHVKAVSTIPREEIEMGDQPIPRAALTTRS